LALLVDTEKHCVGRCLDVEADDVPHLVGERRILGELERREAMRPELVGAPDARTETTDTPTAAAVAAAVQCVPVRSAPTRSSSAVPFRQERLCRAPDRRRGLYLCHRRSRRRRDGGAHPSASRAARRWLADHRGAARSRGRARPVRRRRPSPARLGRVGDGHAGGRVANSSRPASSFGSAMTRGTLFWPPSLPRLFIQRAKAPGGTA
jgi:hypothetical protein